MVYLFTLKYSIYTILRNIGLPSRVAELKIGNIEILFFQKMA